MCGSPSVQQEENGSQITSMCLGFLTVLSDIKVRARELGEPFFSANDASSFIILQAVHLALL